MLKLRVYSERTVDMKGIKTRIGEDALPYISGAGMFVADGMGGSAGIRVFSFDEECFDAERLEDRFLSKLNLSETAPGKVEKFKEYVRDNFSSLLDPAMATIYEDPRNHLIRLKKSGYVGSHALGVVLTSYLLFLENQEFPDEDEWLKTIGEMKEKLFEAYKSAISILGSELPEIGFTNIEYYGTTMSAVFFYEKEEEIVAVFLNSGDSRSYVWDQKGFRQAAEDQGRDGGMTSFFSLSESTIPDISFEIKRYKKPCAIMTMTDGVYSVFGGKDGFHSTPLNMEGYIFHILANSNTEEDAEQKLKQFFDVNGSIDDSNSMVLAAFGYDSYAEFKDAAAEHLNDLDKKYELSSLPDDFYIEDYGKKVKKIETEAADVLSPLLEKAFMLPSVQEYCYSQIMRPETVPRYRGYWKSIDDDILSVETAIKRVKRKLADIAEDNFVDFVDVNAVEKRFCQFVDSSLKKFKIIEDAPTNGKNYLDAWSEREEAMHAVFEELRDLCSYVDDLEKNSEKIQYCEEKTWTEESERASVDWAEQVKEKLKQSLAKINKSLSSFSANSKSLLEYYDNWTVRNCMAKSTYTNNKGKVELTDIVNQWLVNEKDPSVGETTIPFVRNMIKEKIKEYWSLVHKREELEQKRSEAEKEASRKYWLENAMAELSVVLGEDSYFAADPSLKAEIKEALDKNQDLSECKKISDKQKEIFEAYLSDHLSEVSADKISDVEKNGWM